MAGGWDVRGMLIRESLACLSRLVGNVMEWDVCLEETEISWTSRYDGQ